MSKLSEWIEELLRRLKKTQPPIIPPVVPPVIPPVVPPVIRLDDLEKAMVEAGRTFKWGSSIGVKSILTGQSHSVLMDSASSYSLYESQKGAQLGHYNWNQRSQDLLRQFPGLTVHEVTAESFSLETELSAAAMSMFKSWFQSPPHWNAVNGTCKFYGYSMHQGLSKVTGKLTYYGCGVMIS